MCTRSRFRITIVQFVDLNQKMYSICIHCLWNLLYKKGLVKKKWLYIHAMSSNIIARKWKNSVENRDFLWGFWFMCGLFLFCILNFVAHLKKKILFFLIFHIYFIFSEVASFKENGTRCIGRYIVCLLHSSVSNGLFWL